MDFDEFCKLMNSAISSKEFLEVNDCLQNKVVCFKSTGEDCNKERIVKSWIWNNMEIPAETKIFLLLKLLGRDMNSYISPVDEPIVMDPSHALLDYVINDYYNKGKYLFEERSIEDFEEIARLLRLEIFFEYKRGITPFTLAYLQRNHDCFNVST